MSKKSFVITDEWQGKVTHAILTRWASMLSDWEDTDATRVVSPQELPAMKHFLKAWKTTLARTHGTAPLPMTMVKRVQEPTDVWGRVDGIHHVFKFCNEHPIFEPVVGFQFWVIGAHDRRSDGTLQPLHRQSAYVARVHAVAHLKDADPAGITYIDVGTEEGPDYGEQKMIFVACKDALPGWTGQQLSQLNRRGFYPQMTNHTTRAGKDYADKHHLDGMWRTVSDPVEIWVCPTLWLLWEYLMLLGFDNSEAKRVIDKLLACGTRVVGRKSKRPFFLMLADDYREAVSKALEERDAPRESDLRRLYASWRSHDVDDRMGHEACRFLGAIKVTDKNVLEAIHRVSGVQRVFKVPATLEHLAGAYA